MTAWIGAVSPGCTSDLGPCDIPTARAVVYTADEEGLPAYAGQALILTACGGGAFCHTAGIEPEMRFGAPEGMDFDVEPLVAPDATELERLRVAQLDTFHYRRRIWDQVESGLMPPGDVGAEVVAQARGYAGLPSLADPEGREILRNWLSCGVPVVERSFDPTGPVTIGAAIAPMSCADCPVCVDGLTLCAGACVETTSDGANCGTCGHACAAGTVCSGGACIAGECPGATTNCAGSCVDLAANAAHCGSCGVACATGQTCVAGSCGCPSGGTLCGGACTDVQTDPANCGGCGVACGGCESCVAGACTSTGASLSRDVQPIFDDACNSSLCHGGSAPFAGDLSLLPGRSHREVVNVTADCPDRRLLVAPGDPDASYLVHKIEGVMICRGGRMPLRQPALSAARISTIRSWICAGARDD